LRAPVGCEVEDVVLVPIAEIEVAAAHAQLVLVAMAHRYDLAGGCDDRALPDHVIALLEAALGGADHPGAVLVGAGLHHQMVVEQLERIEVETVSEADRRVVAEHDHLDALQAHDAIGLGPPSVVADAHAHDPAEGAEHAESEITDLEIVLLQMLALPPFDSVGRARQMDLAVLADDAAALVDEDGGIEAPLPAAFFVELGIAEMEADLQPLRFCEQRSRLGAGHLAFVERVDLRLVAQ